MQAIIFYLGTLELVGVLSAFNDSNQLALLLFCSKSKGRPPLLRVGLFNFCTFEYNLQSF